MFHKEGGRPQAFNLRNAVTTQTEYTFFQRASSLVYGPSFEVCDVFNVMSFATPPPPTFSLCARTHTYTYKERQRYSLYTEV